MKPWPQSIRHWVLGLSLIPLGFFIVVLVGFLRLEHGAQTADAWAQHSGDVLQQLHRLESDIETEQTASKRYLLTGSQSADQAFRKASAAIPTDAVRLQQLVADNPSQSKLAADLAAFSVRQSAETSKLMEQMRKGNRRAVYEAAVAKALRDPNYARYADRIPHELAAFEATEQQLGAARRASSQQLWRTLQTAILAAMAAGVLIAIAMGLLLGRRIVARLRRLRDGAAEFASCGRLPELIAGNDEISELSRTLRAMAVQVAERNEALKRYQLLADLATDAIVFLRRSDARIVGANRAAVELYGYSHEELVQMTGYDLRTPEAAKLAEEQIPKDDAFQLHFETEHRRKDGTQFPVEVSMQSAYLDGEHMVVSLIRDVTQRQEAEATIQAALNQATEASRLKGEFVATMSHEIRTPMNGVIGMTELLLDTELDPDQRELAMMARDSAHSLLGVINNILDFSKIEAGKLESEITEFDLISKIESIASMLGSQAYKKGISLMTYVDPLIPGRLLGDALQLRQVLVNLAGNAIKFTNEGGVAIIADPVSLGNEVVRIRFAVHDSGVGIPEEALPRLFKAFSQADGSIRRLFGGTGLGLAISKRLVELMGGELKVESTVGRGSTFTFQLNFRVAAPAESALRRDLHDLRAIIVDDDVMSRDILSRYANSWGLRTNVAETADAALVMMLRAAHAGEPYDVALIDFRMPQVDGIELARRVRFEPSLAKTKLLLITAFDAPQQGRDAISAGFAAYLTKPVRQSQLYEAILRNVIGESSQVHASEDLVPVTEVRHEKSILLVEDNDVNRQVFLRQLKRLGYRADYAADGREALERVARDDYELIFMDCQMPIMDGFQTTRAIRKMESTTGKHARIIAMTANALTGDRDECLAAGMDDYLSKPVVLNDLSRVLELDLAVVPTPPVLDTSRLEELFGDDRQEKAAFLASAIRTIRGLCSDLEAAKHPQAMRELLHELKGVSANIGAAELAAAAAACELEIKGNDLTLPSLAAVDEARRNVEEAAGPTLEHISTEA
jgi:two-component system sensor histidine kinase/response regulator